MDKAKKLRALAFGATGRDHVDLDAAAEKNIAILCLKEETAFLSSITATAELAWALMLATVRKIPWGFEAAKKGQWRRVGGDWRGHQISGKTLGVLGYGRLGTITAQYGKAFRMKVLANDTKDIKPEAGVTMVDLDTLLRESDVLSIHIHLQGNEGFFDRQKLNKMKSGSILVNTSRGGIIDEQAFIDVLASGPLAGAGIDVINGEWLPNIAEHPLIRYAATHDNLVITPHLGGVTVESQEMTRNFIIRKLTNFLKAQG